MLHKGIYGRLFGLTVFSYPSDKSDGKGYYKNDSLKP